MLSLLFLYLFTEIIRIQIHNSHVLSSKLKINKKKKRTKKKENIRLVFSFSVVGLVDLFNFLFSMLEKNNCCLLPCSHNRYPIVFENVFSKIIYSRV